MSESFAYTDPLPEGWLQMDAGDELLAQVQDSVAQRAQVWGDEGPHFAAFAGISSFSLSPAVQFESVAHHLQQALELMQRQDAAAVLAPSPATRLPLLGSLWALIRAQAHQLALFYVNRHAAQSVQINQHLLAALTELAQVVAAQQEAVTRFQAEQEAAEPDEGAL